MFPIIARICRQTIGRCFDPKAVTSEQVQHVAEVVHREAAEAGLNRITAKTIAERVRWWIAAHDASRSLWFGVMDLARAHAFITGRISQAHLDIINDHHRGQLLGRGLDYFILSLALCGIVKNTLVENRRTRKEECGTKALWKLLEHAGYSPNGTLIKLCFQILSDAGLIRCLNPGYEIGTRCRRWTPAGPAWTLPFVADVQDSDLSDDQRAEREAFFAGPSTETKTWVGRSYSIESTPTARVISQPGNISHGVSFEGYPDVYEPDWDDDKGIVTNLGAGTAFSEEEDPYLDDREDEEEHDEDEGGDADHWTLAEIDDSEDSDDSEESAPDHDEDEGGPSAVGDWLYTDVDDSDDCEQPAPAPAPAIHPATVVAACWQGGLLLVTVTGGHTLTISGPAAYQLVNALGEYSRSGSW